jgi:hypothetical protein
MKTEEPMRCCSTALALFTLVGVAHAAPPADGPAPTLAPAERALVEGAPAQAAAIATGVLRSRPNDPRALKIVGTASCLLRDPVTALRAAHRLPRVDRLLLEELCAQRGVVLETSGHRPHPLLSSPLASRLYAEGVLAMGRGDLAGAERLLRRAHRAEAAPQILFEIVRCQVKAGQLKRAMATHRRYVAAFHTPARRLAAAARFGELL